MNSLIPIIVRFKVPEDENFIYSSWIKSMYPVFPNNKMTWETFNNYKSEEITEIFSISNTLIACLSEDPSIIIAYLSYSKLNDQFIIHYGYVKEKFRHNKIMNDLLETANPNYKDDLMTFTNLGKTYDQISKSYFTTYNPFLLDLLKDIS